MIEISGLTNLANKIKTFKSEGKIIVLVTGVFDILHSEHIKFLSAAKQVGDLLLVGLESDSRVKQLKGSTRPINNITIRLINLEKLNLADIIFPLPNKFASAKDHRHLITTLKPDILAVSKNTPHQNSKKNIMRLVHGKLIVVHSHNPAISTTQILKNAKS